MAALEVSRTTEPADFESWNAALAKGEQGALFATTHWVETLASAQECSWSLFLCRTGDEVVGGAVVLDQGAGRKGRRFVYPEAPLFSLHLFLPDNLGPARRIPRGVSILGAVEKVLRDTYGEVTLHSPPGLIDLRPFSWSGWRVEPTYAFALPLPLDSSEGGAELDVDVHPPDHLLARLVVERKYGSVCQVRPRAGISFPLLAISDGRTLAPIPLGELPSPAGAREVILTARALARSGAPSALSRVLLIGDRWGERLGDRAVAPLVPVETARITRGGGGRV